MADEKEVVIKISAKNLTASEFEAARKELAGLGAESEKTGKKGQGLRDSFKDVFSVTAQGAGIALGAIATLAAGVGALGVRGATVGDVRDQFDLLNESMGNSADVLTGKLNTAFRGTVTEFDFMRASNEAMSQGLKLSEDQFGLTAKASRVLADRVGGDTKEAYESLLAAMATGKDAQLAQIGLNIDGAKAVEQYAQSVGKQASELSESEQKFAKRTAILREMEKVLAQSGEAEVDFADRIDQGVTAVANFTDHLGEGIASSPRLAAAMGGVATSIATAFGNKQTDLIELVVDWIEKGVLIAFDFGQATLGAADMSVRAFYGVRAILFEVISAAQNTVATMYELNAGATDIAASVPGAGRAFKQMAVETRAAADTQRAVATSFRDTADEAWNAAKGNNEVSKTIQTLRGGLADARSAMIAAKNATEDGTDATKWSAAARRDEATATGEQTKKQKELAEKYREYYNWLGERQMEDAQRQKEFLDKQSADYRAYLNFIEERRMEDAGAHQDWLDKLAAQYRAYYNDIGVRRMEDEAKQRDTWARLSGYIDTLSSDFQHLGEISGGTFGEIAGGVGRIIGSLKLGRDAGKGMSEGLAEMRSAEGNAAVGAAQLATGIMAAVSAMDSATASGSRLLNVLGGASTGAQIGGQVGGGIGAAIGAVAGAFIGFFRNADAGKVRQLSDEFVKAHGGLARLREEADRGGISLERLFNARKVEDFRREAERVQALLDDQKRDAELLQQAMEEYGISWEDLGETARAAKMQELAEGLLDKFRVLVAAGADVDFVIGKMGDQVRDFVKSALRTGTEVPSAMRPMLQKMVEMGLLTDENGEKLTDLEGLTWSQTMTQGFQTVVAKLDELISKLGGSLQAMFQNASASAWAFATTASDALNSIPDVDLHVNGDSEGERFATGTRGVYGDWFHDFNPRGESVTVDGNEAIVPYADRFAFANDILGGRIAGSPATASASTGPVHVNVLVERGGNTRLLSDEEFILAKVQGGFDEGRLAVPERAIAARAGR